MNDYEKAKIILVEMDRWVDIDWNFEDDYIKGIIEGFKLVGLVNK